LKAKKMTTRNSRQTRIIDAKLSALRGTSTLNRRPQMVIDPLFRVGGFFDARDLLQVRYEMVRRHLVENQPVAATARLFGCSLPTAYQAHAAFKARGLAGLIPQRRGPKHGHKLTPEVLLHIEHQRRQRPNLRTRELLAELQRKFGLTIHRRSLERLLSGKKKFPSS
jgi:transposase